MPHHPTNWPAKLADWGRSGLSIAAWCRNNAVSYQTFLYPRRPDENEGGAYCTVVISEC